MLSIFKVFKKFFSYIVTSTNNDLSNFFVNRFFHYRHCW